MSGILQLPQIEATNTMGDGAQPVYMPPSPTRQLREALDQCTPTNGIAPAKTPSGPGEVTPQGTPERVKGLVAQWQRGHAPAFPQQASTPSSLGGAYVEVSCASVLNAEGAGGIGAQEGSGSGKLGMQEDILAPLGSGAVLETPAAAGDGSHNNFSSPLASLTQGTTSTSSTVTASPGRHDPPVVYSKPTPAGPPEEGAGGLQRGLSGTGTQLQVPAPVISMTLEHGDRPVPVSRSSPPLVAMDAKNVERSSDENNMTFRNMYMIQVHISLPHPTKGTSVASRWIFFPLSAATPLASAARMMGGVGSVHAACALWLLSGGRGGAGVFFGRVSVGFGVVRFAYFCFL